MLFLKVFLFLKIVACQFELNENSTTFIKCERISETEEVVLDSNGEAVKIYLSCSSNINATTEVEEDEGRRRAFENIKNQLENNFHETVDSTISPAIKSELRSKIEKFSELSNDEKHERIAEICWKLLVGINSLPVHKLRTHFSRCERCRRYLKIFKERRNLRHMAAIPRCSVTDNGILGKGPRPSRPRYQFSTFQTMTTTSGETMKTATKTTSVRPAKSTTLTTTTMTKTTTTTTRKSYPKSAMTRTTKATAKTDTTTTPKTSTTTTTTTTTITSYSRPSSTKGIKALNQEESVNFNENFSSAKLSDYYDSSSSSDYSLSSEDRSRSMSSKEDECKKGSEYRTSSFWLQWVRNIGDLK